MKKAILMVAAMGMFGGAFAASTKVVQPVTAQVSNVCTYAVDSQEDVIGKIFPQGNKDLTLGQVSNALNTVSSSVAIGAFYIFRCTSGTPWDTTPFVKAGAIVLNGTGGSSAGKTLSVEYTVNVDLAPTLTDTVNGDIHQAGVSFTIPKGQWQSSAGSYSGNLTVEINYN